MLLNVHCGLNSLDSVEDTLLVDSLLLGVVSGDGFSLLLVVTGDVAVSDGEARSFSELVSLLVLCEVLGDFFDFCRCFARRFLNHT